MKWIAALAAFVVYVRWSEHADWRPDLVARGALQGSYAFCSTLLLRTLVIVLYKYHKTRRNPRLLAYFGGLMLVVLLPFGIHYLAGTSNILAATAPGIVMGHFYIVFILLVELRPVRRKGANSVKMLNPVQGSTIKISCKPKLDYLKVRRNVEVTGRKQALCPDVME